MTTNKDKNEIETPASIPAIDGEWIITLNGRVTRESELRLPDPDLQIHGKVAANTRLDGRAAVIDVMYDEENGIIGIELHHQFEDMSGEITYELTREECDDPGQRWTTDSLDPEATVELLPPGEVEL